MNKSWCESSQQRVTTDCFSFFLVSDASLLPLLGGDSQLHQRIRSLSFWVFRIFLSTAVTTDIQRNCGCTRVYTLARENDKIVYNCHVVSVVGVWLLLLFRPLSLDSWCCLSHLKLSTSFNCTMILHNFDELIFSPYIGIVGPRANTHHTHTHAHTHAKCV